MDNLNGRINFYPDTDAVYMDVGTIKFEDLEAIYKHACELNMIDPSEPVNNPEKLIKRFGFKLTSLTKHIREFRDDYDNEIILYPTLGLISICRMSVDPVLIKGLYAYCIKDGWAKC